MTPLDQLIREVTTFDYALIRGYGIYHLESVPEVWEQETESRRKLVKQDWSNAVWVPYSETDFGAIYCERFFSDSFKPPQDFANLSSQALTYILSLPPDSVRQQINRLCLTATKVNEVTDGFWTYVKNEGLWELQNFNEFGLAKVFTIKNYPDFGRRDKLYFEMPFLEWVNGIAITKASVLFDLVHNAEDSSGVSVDIDQLIRVLEPQTITKQIANKPDVKSNAPDDQVVCIDWEKAENKFNNGLPLTIVRKYFMQLTVPPGRNRTPFLTSTQVDLFVRKAFVMEENIGEISLTVGSKDKLYVWKLFYQLYDYCWRNNYEETSQCRQKYIDLLTNNFTNYKHEKIKANFGSNKCKRSWKTPAELE